MAKIAGLVLLWTAFLVASFALVCTIWQHQMITNQGVFWFMTAWIAVAVVGVTTFCGS